MADVSAFPTMHDVLVDGNNILTLTATTAVKAGQVVDINATGVSMAVDPAVATGCTVGVALYDAAAGAPVAVATIGCVVYVANADDTTTVDAGDWLETNDNAVGGTVSVAAVAASGGATATFHNNIVGKALDDIAGGGTGRMLITLGTLTQANSS